LPPDTHEALTTRWADFIKVSTAIDIWERVQRLEATPPRRYLPGHARSPSSERRLLLSLLQTLITAVDGDSAAAEVLFSFFPRILLPRNLTVSEALKHLLDNSSPPPPNSARAPISPESIWAGKLEEALTHGDNRRFRRLLERGPAQVACIEDPLDWIQGGPDGNRPDGGIPFFPDVPIPQEEAELERSCTLAATNYKLPIKAKDILSWARSHTATNPGSTGWSGMLLIQLHASDRQILKHIARLWSRHPSDYKDKQVALHTYRVCDGWLIPQPGKKPRPIAAPQVIRRIVIAKLMSSARPSVQNFCRSRRQIGPEGDGPKLAYSLIANLVVASGGTSFKQDREASYQSFHRAALNNSIKALIENARSIGRPAEAAAIARAAALVHLTGRTPPSSVYFRSLNTNKDITSLAQGCTLSPALEAATLTSPHPQAPGIVQLHAHDDLQTSFLNTVLPANVALPNTDDIGGRWNNSKAEAVGIHANTLVELRLATAAVPHITVWGRPVGDIRAWFSDVWLPRFSAIVQSIETLASLSRCTAISAAMQLKGPAALARHWIRGTPTPQIDSIMDLLSAADDRWVDLILGLAQVANPSPWQRKLARAAIFGQTLAHEALSDHAALISAQTMLDALHHVASLTAGAKVVVHQAFSTALTGTQCPDRNALLTALLLRRDIAQALHKQRMLQYTTDYALDSQAGERNAFVDALRLGGARHDWPAAHGLLSGGGRSPLAFALCRALKAPIWGTIGGPRDACALCGAKLADDLLRPTHHTSTGLDNFGEHIHACRKMPPRISSNAKHNALARGMAEIARYCGIDAAYCSKPLWSEEAGDRDAPADILEEGVAIDVTIRGGPYSRFIAAEKQKEQKYAHHRMVDSSFVFLPAVISTTGDIGHQWCEHLKIWGTRLAAQRAAEGQSIGLPHDDVRGAFGHLFSVVSATQAFAWADANNRKRNKETSNPEIKFHGLSTEQRPRTRTTDVQGISDAQARTRIAQAKPTTSAVTTSTSRVT